MSKVKYVRQGTIIFIDGKPHQFGSRNKARQESWKIQMAEDKALGRGCLKLKKVA